MTAILGMRGTGTFPADHRAEDWRQKYLMLEPNGSAPLTAVLSMLKSEKTKDPKYHNFRKDLPEYRITFATSGVSAFNNGGANDGTSVVATSASDASFIRVGMLLRNWRTGEVVKVTDKPSSTGLTVTRGVGASGAGATVQANDIFFMVGNGNPEGADVPSAVSYDAASTENLTQIFRTPLSISRTAMHTEFRTGDQYAEKARDALKEHMVGIEKAMLWGKKDEITGSNGQKERYTGGIISYLTTNVLDASVSLSNVITEAKFDEYLAEQAFAFGSSQKLALVGWKAMNNINQIAKARWQITSPSNSYGMSYTSYMTPFGELVLKTHPLFRQIPGAESMALILDTADFVYRYIDDTSLLKDRQSPGVDGVVDEYLTEAGLEMLQEKTHGLILNWDAISA